MWYYARSGMIQQVAAENKFSSRKQHRLKILFYYHIWILTNTD